LQAQLNTKQLSDVSALIYARVGDPESLAYLKYQHLHF
jgi:hypothetical protein